MNLFTKFILELYPFINLTFQRSINEEAFIQCAKNMNVDLGQKDLVQKPEFKCLFKCMFELDGVLKDGVLLEDPIIKSIQDEKDLNPTEKDKLVKAVPKCLDAVKSTADVCVKSFSFGECLYKSAM